MHGPVVPGWLLVALCAATGSYCLLRLRSGSEQARRAAGGEAVMGFGMAAMAVPAAFAPPGPWMTGMTAGYAAVFGGAALRALWLARGGAHHLHHVVGSLAMVYMALAMAPGGGDPAHEGHTGHAGHAAGGVPLLTGALLLYFAGYVLSTGTRLLPSAGGTGSHGAARPVPWGARPELALACRLSMGIAMLAMLVTV
ncbi:DUF5134 domain-containing protein [Streptomyces sp. NPDC048361]|uniref:DUF5134 domain-containing protein n=1 Tax=Streptomyces sp. NPDC048361 TaxID=3154720 RepID=UPI003413D8E7